MTHGKLRVALGLGLEARVRGETADGGGEGAAGDEGGHRDGLRACDAGVVAGGDVVVDSWQKFMRVS